MPHGPVQAIPHLSPGHVALVHGPCHRFNPCPMGQCEYPMGQSCAVSHLSRGHGVLDHGKFQLFSHCPMGMWHWSMGHVTCSISVPWATVNPPWSCLSWTTPVPWACCIGPWDMSHVQPLSHGPMLIPHGPVFCCVTSVPWALCTGPWGLPAVQPPSHGPM
jgi:hypothetical protein